MSMAEGGPYAYDLGMTKLDIDGDNDSAGLGSMCPVSRQSHPSEKYKLKLRILKK